MYQGNSRFETYSWKILALISFAQVKVYRFTSNQGSVARWGEFFAKVH